MDLFAKRLVRLVLGLLICGFGVFVTLKANVGFAPAEVFSSGLSHTLGLPIGFITVVFSTIVVTVDVLLGEKIGIGTIIDMLLVGTFIDVLLNFVKIPPCESLALGILLLIAGMFIISTGVYLYMSAGFGAGPLDSLMVVFKRRVPFSVGVCRGIIELSLLAFGYFLGGGLGIGTVIFVFGFGFCLQIVFYIVRYDPAKVKNETLNETYVFLKTRLKKG